jgi:hypothetical protein
MILRAARWATRPLHPSAGNGRSGSIPYDMFNFERASEEVAAARSLERIYHKGQDKAWNGKEVLAELVEKHGGVHIPAEQIEPLKRIFATIFWGELAAWKVSSELALELVPLEAKMAAVSQAHDEARHFYVLHDYLALLGYTPDELTDAGNRIIAEIVGANSLAKKIMGMQLMVEPIALTLFQLVREKAIEPVLCDLLAYYERDEARHVALGVHYLPDLIRQMGPLELVDFYAWQVRMFMIQMDGVKELEQDFHALGFTPEEAIRLGEIKQLTAARMVVDQLPPGLPVEELITRIVEFRMALDFPAEDTRRREQWQQALQALFFNSDRTREIQRELARAKEEHAA